MKFVESNNDESMRAHSDLKFLERLVFIPRGQNAGFTTLRDLIGRIGASAFASWYVLGETSYEFNYFTGGFEEVNREPFPIYDARSSKVVDSVGALRVYRRFCKDPHWYMGWVSNGAKLSGYKRNRSVKTMNPKRNSAVCVEDGEPPFSPKIKSLPTKRDDIRRGCNKDRSWKGYRKVQYKDGAF
ncbi:hypothetical protein RYA05_05695 [Pseudomonas syringae pv. actinidiae]|nr:hypothetical protein [Pseudomonas syringae pv. actinidiae]